MEALLQSSSIGRSKRGDQLSADQMTPLQKQRARRTLGVVG
jgi:hypothetical protein